MVWQMGIHIDILFDKSKELARSHIDGLRVAIQYTIARQKRTDHSKRIDEHGLHVGLIPQATIRCLWIVRQQVVKQAISSDAITGYVIMIG
jgi:predicted N-formylglutamate amidohydrolase